MNLILIERRELLADGKVRLSDRRAEHLREVLAVDEGRELRAAIVGEGTITARVLSVSTEDVVLEITDEPAELVETTRLHLILALPRPKALRRIIQSISCLGVHSLDLVNAWKVSSSYFSSPLLSPERLRSEAILGAEQGGRYRLPEIRVNRLFMPFLDSLPAESNELRLLAHPRADATLDNLISVRPAEQITLAIGPEGGWIGREIESLQEKGFAGFRIADSILRSEIAIVAAIAQIDLLSRMAATRPSDL